MTDKDLVVPVPLALAQAIVEYLADRPYREVSVILAAVTAIEPVACNKEVAEAE